MAHIASILASLTRTTLCNETRQAKKMLKSIMHVDFLDRSVALEELRQFQTYGGLLEGRPTKALNRERIKDILLRKENSRFGVHPILVPPKEIVTHYPGDSGNPFPRLPAVVCVGLFDSSEPSNNGEGGWSGQVAIWFQDTFALPIDESVLQYFHHQSWADCAGSYDW